MLIREVTRRVNRNDVWHAVYTAGVVLTKPVAECRYYHRSLNPEKLVAIKFSSLPQNMTMRGMIKKYQLPVAPPLPGFRPMTKADVPEAHQMLMAYLAK